MAEDPRVKPLTEIVLQIMQENNYNPHFASVHEHAHMETVLFLARYDAALNAPRRHIRVHCPNIGPYSEDNPKACVNCGKPARLWSWFTEECTGESQWKSLSQAVSEALPAPIPMILFCPAPGCGLQHIDAEEDHAEDCAMLRWRGEALPPKCDCNRWRNPPHRTHKCHDCGHMWRPADVRTVGVAEIETKGSHDHCAVRGRISSV